MFDKLVRQVDDAVFNTVNTYMEELMGGPFGEESHDAHVELQERALVALLKKYRPENVIFVEEEENAPKQVVYGVYSSLGTWLCDVSGITEGELFDDLVDAMDAKEGDVLMEYEFSIGDDDILFQCKERNYTLKKK